MIFSGTQYNVEQWRELLNKELNKQYTSILVNDNDGASLSVRLTADERQIVMDNLWTRVESNAPTSEGGHQLAWCERLIIEGLTST